MTKKQKAIKAMVKNASLWDSVGKAFAASKNFLNTKGKAIVDDTGKAYAASKDFLNTKGKAIVGDTGKALFTSALVIGLGRTVDLLIEEIQKKSMQAKSKEYYAKMLEAHPQLQREDPKLIAQYWTSLRHFAPHMSEDPLAAGAYITQSIRRVAGEELGGPPPDTFATLVDIAKKQKESRNSGISFREEAAKATTSAVVANLIKGTLAHATGNPGASNQTGPNP